MFEDEEDEQSEADTFEDSKHDTNYLGVENVLDQFHAHSKQNMICLLKLCTRPHKAFHGVRLQWRLSAWKVERVRMTQKVQLYCN